MSVSKDKTLAKVRTFAQDFNEHKPATTTSTPTPPTTKPAVVSVKKSPAKPTPPPAVTASIERELKKQKEITATAPTPTPPPPPPPPKKTVASKPIPKITVAATPTPKKKKINSGAPATVITATKKAPGRPNQQTFLASIQKWFAELFTRTPKQKTPTYSVSSATRRKGVIEKAATKSGTVFTSDAASFRTSLAQRSPDLPKESHLTWSPHTESVFELLEAPATAVQESDLNPPAAVPAPPAQATIATTPSVPDRVDERWEPATSPPAPTPPPITSPVVPPPAPLPAEETIPVEPVQPAIQTVPPKPPAAPATAAATPAPVAIKKPASPILSSVRALLAGERELPSTNAIALGLVAGFSGIVAIVVVVQTLAGLLMSDTPEATKVERVTILPNTSLVEYQLPTSGVDPASISATAPTLVTTATAEVLFTTTADEPVAASSLVNLFGLSVNPSFAESITDVRLVVLDTVQLGLVLTVTDSFTALGGMLEWEATMAADLDPLLNLITTPAAATRFVDESRGNLDLRVLTDGSDTVLVYGFLDEETILITKRVEAFGRFTQ